MKVLRNSLDEQRYYKYREIANIGREKGPKYKYKSSIVATKGVPSKV